VSRPIPAWERDAAYEVYADELAHAAAREAAELEAEMDAEVAAAEDPEAEL
jgi:hypothetical protein